MSKIKRFIYSLIFYSFTGLGISLTIRANIGVSSFNSMNVAISSASQIQVGTITMLINLAFLLAYMILTKFSHPLKYCLQAISVLLLGVVINFFTYYFFPNLLFTNYWQKLFVFILGTIIGGLSTGMVVNFDTITFPIESFCLALVSKTNFSFAKLRYFIDIISVITSLAISCIFSLPLFVREGTIISLLLLIAMIHLSKEMYQKYQMNKNLQA